ncbi:hypothetical protein KY319_02890 [Candidatus Woesearchaeota archaeon]|nr:hypothetical protein [Candidatus Woesearchaeota archaeon]
MKKGQVETLNWLIEILKEILPLILVVAIVVGLLAIVWRGEMQPPEKDFKKILEATDHLLERFEDGKLYSSQEITVPLDSEKPFQIAFYPGGGPVMPPACKGRTCVCMYFMTNGKKETCKTIETSKQCQQCGEDLCSGPYNTFTVEKGDAVTVSVDCTNSGSRISYNKA